MIKRAKSKLYAEIKIHKMLDHSNIVQFIDCFEDEENQCFHDDQYKFQLHQDVSLDARELVQQVLMPNPQ
ncbi:hypothetical protein EI94DRAFT_1819644 [Lactarius quietus]|nr:hypothetical protein EI94DRAFT_1819644 [Lactarius quietus]